MSSNNFNFVVRNGLVVNGSFTANGTVVNAAAINAQSLAATLTIAVGSNVNINATTISVGTTSLNSLSFNVGNTTVNTSIAGGTLLINGVNVNTAITGNAATAFTNATTFSANATNLTGGTLATARLPATANIATAINVGANVNIDTSTLTISAGNTTFANASFIRVGNSTVNAVISAGSLTINGVNVNTSITSNASAAFTNATTFSANATNLTNGTLAVARLSGSYNIGISGTANNATNLNGQAAGFYNNADNMNTGTLPAARLSGTYSITNSGTANNATNLAGQGGGFYTNAGNMNTGTLPSARLSGSYSITAADSFLLAGQNSGFYTNIPARLGFTPANRAGDTFTGGVTFSAGAINVGGGTNQQIGLFIQNASRSVQFYLIQNGDIFGLFDNSGGFNRFFTDSSGNFFVHSNITAFASDRRLKKNLRPISETPLDDLKKLGGYRFDWREDGPQPMRGTDVGLIAQEVESILPEALAPAPFDNEYKTIKLNQQITALLVEAIKELTAKVESLESRLKAS